MLPEYGSTRSAAYRPLVVHQTIPLVDHNAAILQELLANQKREFDEFKQMVLASLRGRGNRPDERALMDLQQFPRDLVRDFHERYKDIVNNIPRVDNKIAYMAVYHGLNYGKLKKALVLETPLTKDELTQMVNKHIDMENLERNEGPSGDLREKLGRKDNQGHSKKPIWDRLSERGHSFRKPPYSPPRRELVRCAQPISQQPMAGQIPLRVAISEIYSQMANK
ncbi:hypothetical protein LIER_35243 [Lithospermum erythrorhizon]|uniref:Retrotransposon gag domain-containing protein n=1 Tax=Lithospermum erythrorhizon TaxID=34254 RepID=A0AAV3NME1_LITER